MYKKLIATYFIFLFMVLIAAPSIIAVCDDSTDTSLCYSLLEVDEDGYSKNKNSSFQLDQLEITINYQTRATRNYNYSFRNYKKPNRNLILPTAKNRYNIT
ncbi:hypothetical protein [Siansivirga zeaxanthinifaciens]|uniref:Secreted protein n=1 Tax=Siansivirga zeaxanthinifaciens CC-SAMT-1 TaxID=1454006 RepID=A0A0C5WHZ3_9FLAO|nr:hypothetical protein [Siansivirga zeaxanthinifaciens]AJR04779.1 hypothetical protein AW14_04265 [Siansivirga zeaxanthinifaciens CC-SAMT-1]